MAEFIAILLFIGIPVLLVYIFIYMPIRAFIRWLKQTGDESVAEAVHNPSVRMGIKPSTTFPPGDAILKIKTRNIQSINSNNVFATSPKVEGKLLHPEDTKVNFAYRRAVTPEMLYDWKQIDDNTYKMYFSPAPLFKNFTFYVWVKRHEDYQFCENLCGDNLSVKCVGIYNLPMPFAPIPYGVVEINPNYPTTQFGSKILEDGEEILTVYAGEEAMRRIDKINLREEQKRKEKIRQRLLERQRARDLEKVVEQEMIDSGELYEYANKRHHIPKDVQDAVWRRDGGRCVYCGSNVKIHIDHIIPVSKGGSNHIDNLQILCQKCNLEKSNKIG